MNKFFQITEDHERWAKNAKRKYKKPKQFWLDLIKKQNGKCALTQAGLLFNKKAGTPKKGKGKGCHPLYAAVDHINPSRANKGFQILCYDINDLKGHLPIPLFDDLIKTKAWKKLVKNWGKAADSSPRKRNTFKKIIKRGY